MLSPRIVLVIWTLCMVPAQVLDKMTPPGFQIEEEPGWGLCFLHQAQAVGLYQAGGTEEQK